MGDNQLFDLKGKTVAVIGGGSGIGEAVATGAARLGAQVVVVDANGTAAARVASALEGGDAKTLDITDGRAVHAVLDEIAAAHGRLDGVVCTPSINVRKPLLQYNEEDFDKVVGINLKGSFNVIRAAGRIMTAQRSG